MRSEKPIVTSRRALAFEYLENPEALEGAKQSLTVLLHVLQNLYDVTPAKKQLTLGEIVTHAKEMYRDVSAEIIERGLYFVQEFPVLEPYGSSGARPSQGGIPSIDWVVVHERIVTINPEAEWDDSHAAAQDRRGSKHADSPA